MAIAVERRGMNAVLAGFSALLLALVLLAVARGQAQWGRLPPLVWVHLLTMLGALALTPAMLLRAKGTRGHRRLGWLWVALMLVTAGVSLFFKVGSSGYGVFSGDFSVIHALSLLVLVQVPRLVLAARRHDAAGHQRAVQALVIGALLLAGFFTLPFGRLLGTWLTG
ncbi:DUF2306 domain-containing protein [Sandaracinobacteroides saxicola]|uniref:DUF2306 domain-containing protein n=1 Tax=Sandaracinobacteroides saxicola TaxID=2759707 RepID=A0A7G5IL12_9SPHN|nr:hypothetical protein [Sandaracinobacteroides saxicola]QMW24054.1 hypothetical protein H3309_06215 [Sandaracinobacteroides saxicola]